jgi:hypothetical protein
MCLLVHCVTMSCSSDWHRCSVLLLKQLKKIPILSASCILDWNGNQDMRQPPKFMLSHISFLLRYLTTWKKNIMHLNWYFRVKVIEIMFLHQHFLGIRVHPTSICFCPSPLSKWQIRCKNNVFLNFREEEHIQRILGNLFGYNFYVFFFVFPTCI